MKALLHVEGHGRLVSARVCRARSRAEKTALNRARAVFHRVIDLVPLLIQMGSWGLRHTPASKQLSVRGKILEDGRPEAVVRVHAETAAPPSGGAGAQGAVFSRLQSAHEAVIAEPLV